LTKVSAELRQPQRGMKSIRRQLTLTLLTGFGLLLAAGCAALYVGTREVLLREFDALLLTKARALASVTEVHHGDVKLEFDDELMPEFGGRQPGAFFQLWLADGHVLERSRSLGGRDLPRFNNTIPPNTPRLWNLQLADGKPGRAVSLTFFPPVEEEDKVDDAAGRALSSLVTVVVAQDRTRLDAHLRVFAIGAAAASAAMMAGAALVATFSTRRALASLAKLGQQVAAIDESSLGSCFACEHLPAELNPICHRLNDLLARLDAAFVRERRFSDDVAHELRTPVAELRALAEVSLASEGLGPQALAGFQDALAIAQQMEEIVNGLLAVARYESGSQAVRREPLPLVPLLFERWKPHAVRAADRSLKVTLNVPADLSVLSDRALLRVIISNVFSNAADYAPAGSEVSIAALCRGDAVQLTISNPAGTLSTTDLPNLFERFWRKDAARTSSNHAGLGLAIAQAAARLLSTELTAKLTETGLISFGLTLPISEGNKATRNAVESSGFVL